MPRTLTALVLPLLITLLYVQAARGGDTLHFASSEAQTTLVELYTSEGCSSCPPADRWLGQFKANDGLWQHVVPVAFHVDYWNYLGWEDPFADARYANRQYRYKALGHVGVVYTPGVMVNGREWRGWHWTQTPPASPQRPGILAVLLEGNSLSAKFHALKDYPTLVLNVAWLGFDLHSDVSRGENRGRSLNHDFVVLQLQQVLAKNDNGHYHWQLGRANHGPATESRAIAVWLSTVDDPTPIQATGSWLQLELR